MRRFGIICTIALLSLSCQPGINEPQKPKNIILLIGDGMGVSHIYAGLTANQGKLSLERCTHYGFSKTHSASHWVTDSGAGGTAISTGTKTYNGAIAVDTDSLPLKTILEYAEDKNLSTGLISTSSITHATPASFIAHNKARGDYEGIAIDFLKTEFDVVIGGGYDQFAKRSDSVNLLDEFIARGYQIAQSMDEVAEVETGKLLALTAPVHNSRFSAGRGDMFPLATKKAIELLSQNENGFFMMAEGSMIDWGGHANDTKYIVEEMIDFDKAIEVALDFAEENKETLVLITADHETGGFGLNGFDSQVDTIAGGYTTGGHTGVMVPVLAYGPGAEEFVGIQDNTDLFRKMMKLLNLNNESEEIE